MIDAIQNLQYADRIIDIATFYDKVERNFDHAQRLDQYGLHPSAYFFEAMEYHRRAQILQDRQLGKIPETVTTGDDLMDTVPIYDTVQRRYAGFSNAIEYIWYGQDAPKAEKFVAKGIATPNVALTEKELLYLFFFHRLTGSGASFEQDHGFRNSYVLQLARDMQDYGLTEALVKFRVYATNNPVFTSIGNQIAQFPPAPLDWKQGIYYLCSRAMPLVEELYQFLQSQAKPIGIQPATEAFLKMQQAKGQVRFKFVSTAFVMDIAEYFPQYVDSKSDCFHGKNAIEALNLVFDRRIGKPRKDQAFYDVGTRFFADTFGTNPSDVEDASPGCDLVRWVEQYIPKVWRGDREATWNSSSLKHPAGRQKS